MAAAAEAAAEKTEMPYIPHELVTLILVRLPVASLVWFSSVCKARRSTVSGDASFRRAHLRLQKPFLLLSPWTVRDLHMEKIVMYRLEENQQQGTTPPIVHAMDPSSQEPMLEFVHCDGLVLLPGEATVRVVNPSTHRALTLPWSPRTERPCVEPFCSMNFSHQAFGLGHDPRSDAYKVARFSYRALYEPMTGEY